MGKNSLKIGIGEKEVERNMLLHRYMSFEKFKQMVEDEALCFVNPLTKWEDKTEGMIFRMAKDEDGWKTITETILSSDRLDDKKKPFIMELLNGSSSAIRLECRNCQLNHKKFEDRFQVRCQSWCKNSNCPNMWSEYAKVGGVCITVELSKLKALKFCGSSIGGFEVKYVEFPDGDRRDSQEFKNFVNKNYDKILGNHGEFYYTLAYRLKDIEQFEWETEYRLYVTGVKCSEIAKIPINMDMKNFIEEVRVNPYATIDEFHRVETFCRAYGLKFASIKSNSEFVEKNLVNGDCNENVVKVQKLGKEEKMIDNDDYGLLEEFEKGVSLEKNLDEHGFPQMSYDIFVSILRSLKERTELDEFCVNKIFIEVRKLLDDYKLEIRMQCPINTEKCIQYIETKKHIAEIEELYSELKTRFIKE